MAALLEKKTHKNRTEWEQSNDVVVQDNMR